MSSKKLIVIFPGQNSSASPLIYYAGFKYYQKGYEELIVNYGGFSEETEIKQHIKAQFENVDFADYDDILFVSKSMGSIAAGWLDDALNLNARHIYLTPVAKTLPYLKRGKNIQIVILGTNDIHMDSEVLKAQCEREGIPYKLIEGANHSLEIDGDIAANIDILKQIVELY